jgi:exosortase
MVPLPVALYARIASPLQLMVSQVATEVLNAAGIPVLREGNMMTLPRGVRMFVAEACSGMRQLTGFLALTVAVAYLSARPAWYRLTIVASAIPIAMTANVARVVLTGFIMHRVNPEFALGAYHTAEGLLMMGFGLSLLRGECWIMDQVCALTRPAEPSNFVPPPREGAEVRDSMPIRERSQTEALPA